LRRGLAAAAPKRARPRGRDGTSLARSCGVSCVTNRVGVETLRDLLEGARTAALAYVDETGAVQALPAAFHWREGRIRLGVPIGAVRGGGRVAIVVDEGWFWWDLRAVLARGALTPSAPPGGAAAADLAWFELAADRVTAWDYSRLHEEP
jgi:hypothetical protein